MGYQSLANYLITLGVLPFHPHSMTLLTALTTDGTNEAIFAIGYINLSSGPGTSKVLSSSGGKIHFKTGSVTWANGSTSVRVGVQDVTVATGLGDGTFDAYADAVPGATTITANVMNAIAITTGSKTISHGDLVAIGSEVTNRAGADSIQWHCATNAGAGGYPHGGLNTGSGLNLNVSVPQLCIEFDDGTVGWLNGVTPYQPDTALNVNSGSTPDEYGMAFQFPFPVTIGGFGAWVTNVVGTDDFEIVLYSDPFGTPVAEDTLAVDASGVNTTALYYNRVMTSPYSLPANTPVLVSVKPTTANNITPYRLALGSGGSNLRKMYPCGTNHATYSRSDETGAFGSADTENLMVAFLSLSAFDDGTGGGSGGVNRAALPGGLSALG